MAAKSPSSKLKSYSPKAIYTAPPEQRRHILRRFWLPAVLLLALAAGGLTGIIAAYELNYSRAANEVADVVDDAFGDFGEGGLRQRRPRSNGQQEPAGKNASVHGNSVG